MSLTVQTREGVTCRKLVKEYRSGDARVRALRGVDLELYPGQLTLLVGPSGCGKTTANLKELKDVRDRNLKTAPGTISPQEMVASELAYQAARVQLTVAQTNLALLKAGAWDADKLIAYTAVKQARAQVEQDRTTLDLLKVVAPMDGTILQINVRPGEYVAPAPGQALVMMGSLKPLHVRVNIDEEDLPRLRLNAPARAKLRGDARQEEIPMTFVRLEPYVMPKTSLTGTNTVRVDTRVVQLVYAIDPEQKLVRQKKVLVGQLVDVFIDTGSPAPDGESRAGRTVLDSRRRRG